jgi:hypothetical protein
MLDLFVANIGGLAGARRGFDRDQQPQDHGAAAARGLDHKVGGGKHDKYEHSRKPGVLIVVRRHTKLSTGVARSIAKKAGWL